MDPDNSVNVIEFKNPSSFVSPYGSKYALYTQAFNLANENDYPITVSYSGAHVAPQDITVNLGTDPAALNQYNTEQSTHYDLIPSNLYSMPASVVIPRGQRTVTVDLKLKSNSFDFSKNYVLPIQIQSASTGTVSGNFGTILLNVNAKNNYDGTYRSTGYFTHPTASSSRAIDKDKTLATVNFSTVVTEFADLGGSGWLMWLTVNADNTVTITPKGSTASGVIQEGVNKYDPSTKTFTLNYKYSGSGGFRVVTETIKLK